MSIIIDLMRIAINIRVVYVIECYFIVPLDMPFSCPFHVPIQYPLQLNPDFTYFTTWDLLKDVFHSVTAVTKNLSALGIAMMAVRDVEALSAL